MLGRASRYARSSAVACIVAGIALTTAGCSSGSRTFDVTFPAENQTLTIEPLPVSLVDNSGLVSGFRLASPNPNWPEGVQAVPGDQTALVITWVGGACDQAVSMTSDGASNALRVAVKTSSVGGCRLLGVGRGLELDFNHAVRAQDVTLSVTKAA